VIVWIDEQLSPALGTWLAREFGVTAFPVRDLGLQGATDLEIFLAALHVEALVVTKDHDFVRLLERLGPPPRVLRITCGNTSNERLRIVLSRFFARALDLLTQGEVLVEGSDAR
jgi:predicted nuclease of predicted toxin-antitoxin system